MPIHPVPPAKDPIPPQEASSSPSPVLTQPLTPIDGSYKQPTIFADTFCTLTADESLKVCENIRFPGVQKDIIPPSTQNIKDLGLLPQFSLILGSSKLHFSTPLTFKSKQWLFFIVENEHGEKTARLAYLSTSQGVWRVFYGSILNQICKGSKEIDTQLPIEFNCICHQLFPSLKDIRKVSLSDSFFQSFHEEPVVGDQPQEYSDTIHQLPFLKPVNGEPADQTLASQRHTKWMNPSSMLIERSEHQPDFESPLGSFNFSHPSFPGKDTKASIFPSINGDLLYLFYEVENYGVFLAAVDFQKHPDSQKEVPITSYGNKDHFPDCENLIEPLSQYLMLIPRDYKPEGHLSSRGNMYSDNRKYVFSIPIIQLYMARFSLDPNRLLLLPFDSDD